MKLHLVAALAVLSSTPALADMRVSIPFAAEIGGKAFSCSETYAGLGSTGAEVKAVDFRLFVSNAALVRKDGTLQPITLDQDGQWQTGSTALIDFEDASGGCTNGTKALNTTLRGIVPAGEYQGLSFTVGVPFEINHGDPTLAPAPLNTTAMFWNWQGGYKFVRIDMVPTDRKEDGPKGWFLHLGSTQCDAASKTESPKACKNGNRIDVQLDSFRPDGSTVVIDPAPVVAGADLRVNAPETSPGCMAFPKDPDCMTVMTKLGLPYMDVAAGPQALVSLR
ncbi:MbnP family copper-binding protein [Pannonibacter tanglangensis]|uniref:MbnP family copper-binding protein n=1 Tax=Pannonibacter tanglangensis TaxID=2750084 RepID=UPI001AD90559|nr:MbnP family copper-binding protein [Pannonibacter sp. XCT-53]